MEIPVVVNLEKRKAKNVTVKLTDKLPESASHINSSSSKICLICSENRADYCCPRCYKPYCSLNCYQKHDSTCTEEFFRSHIGKVLKLESQKNLEDSSNLIIPKTELNSSTSSSTNPLSDFSEEELETLAEKIRRSELSSLSQSERQQLSKVNRLMSHMHHVWSPFWESPAAGTEEDDRSVEEIQIRSTVCAIGKIDLERISHLRTEFLTLRNHLVKRIPQQLRPQARSVDSSQSSCLSYQLLGALLGYVVMMRSTGGGWRVSSAEQESDPSEDSPDSPLSCLQLLLQSTPLVDRSFRPLSVSQTVSDWMLHATHSLPSPSAEVSSDGSHRSRRSQAIKALLVDVRRILSQRELLFYCLLDLWLLGFVSSILLSEQSKDPKATHQILELSLLACAPPATEVPIAKVVFPYLISPNLSTTQSSSGRERRGSHKQRSEPVELFTRKVAYLISHFLVSSYDECGEEQQETQTSSIGWQERLSLELQLYVTEFM